MRRCPHCQCELTPVEYEGFVVHRCAQCNGHLVSSSRLDAIKHLGQRPKDELKAEAAAEFRGSRPERIRCPRCHMAMRKEAIRLPVLAAQMDVCRDCALVWLDGGELALAQLGHEATAQFVSAQEMKRRMAELESSPERRAAFERNLANLPDSEDPLEAAMAEALEEAVWTILRGVAHTALRGPGARSHGGGE